jgi:hypothetical protein
MSCICSYQTEARCSRTQSGNHFTDQGIKLHTDYFGSMDDPFATNLCSEGFVFHLFAHRGNFNAVDTFIGANQRYCGNKTTQFVNGVKCSFERCLWYYSTVISMAEIARSTSGDQPVDRK